ncbi:MAG: indolepyruvate oxidoreductase subunit beta [Candidatus Bathyarchaeota archaeon]|jgi:indolepyruvate ferredoxin oxidoreductase beta subunit
MDTLRIVIAGVGGQGTLLASKLLAQSAIDSGLSVKIGETYGMAQRGGPVMGHLQIGGEAESPQIRPCDADVLLGFEIGEAVRRGVSYLKRGGLALVNTKKLPPVEVISGMMEYPGEETLISLLKEITPNLVAFNATSIAEEAGDAIATNMVMLGALSAGKKLPFKERKIIKTIKKQVRPSYLDTNLKAFKMGRDVYMTAP